MNGRRRRPRIERDGWELVSAEDRHRAQPDTFEIPPLADRRSLAKGDAAKLLFDIATRQDGRILDRGVDRMWVVVKSRRQDRYLGVLANDPGMAEGLSLAAGDAIEFGPEHVADIDHPPRAYILETFGVDFFDD